MLASISYPDDNVSTTMVMDDLLKSVTVARAITVGIATFIIWKLPTSVWALTGDVDFSTPKYTQDCIGMFEPKSGLFGSKKGY